MTFERPILAALAAFVLLFSISTQAQRVGVSAGGTSGGFSGARSGSAAASTAHGNAGVGGHAGSARTGGRFDGSARSHGGHNRGGDVIVAPLWYDGWGGWYQEPYSYPQPEPPEQAVIVAPPAPEPARIAPNPKVVEVPATMRPTRSSKLPAAVFILSNGQRIEAERYLLTADHVQLTVNRNSRIIPLSELDLKATLAANGEHGIDLHIPTDGSEISLGF
jgi:hypothetical protein